MTLPSVATRNAHVFLGADHARAERRTWLVIALAAGMMAAEIAGGLMFGSIALVADGVHMSTHAGALLLAALAYRYARRLAHDGRFAFGTGKLGDLAGYTSAIVLGCLAVLVGWEAGSRLLHPVSIRFGEAVPLAVLGLLVNLVSAWLLGGGHEHERNHSHAHPAGTAAASRDNNMRAAVLHVMADAAVSVLVITGLLLARYLGWWWMDPAAGLVGAAVIASWSVTLLRDTGAVLLDMVPDREAADGIRGAIERAGDRVADLHLWRLGPGHLGAVVEVSTAHGRGAMYYRELLAGCCPSLSHLTVEVRPAG